MEQYFNELRKTGALVLAGFDNDQDKATAGLTTLNEALQSNPQIIPFLSNKDNQAAFSEIIELLNDKKGKKDMLSLIPKVVKIGKKLKM